MSTEIDVISAVLENKDINPALAQNLDECFVTHGDMWESVKRYYKIYGTTPSPDKLRSKHPEFRESDVSGPTQYYVDQLKSGYLNNTLGNLLIGGIHDLKGSAPSEVLARMQKEMTGLARLTNSVKDLNITDYENAGRYYDDLRSLTEEMGGTPGIRTGFKALDAAYPTGLAPGHLIVLIGWPGRGKSWISEYLMCQAWMQGHRPMIISLEMSPEDMRNRIYTLMGSGIFRMSDFQKGMVNTDDFRSWGKKTLTDKPEFIIVSNEGVGEVTPDIIQAKIDQYKPSIVVADYHQLLTDNGRSKQPTERNMNISRELKRLALSNNIPVIDITAATMDDISDTKGPPMLSQVAWSEAIEYDADMAMAIHHHQDTNLVECVERKNRHGPSFAFYLEADFGRGTLKETYGTAD